MHVDQLPFRVLLDRPPEGKRTGPYRRAAGTFGSGRSFDIFEIGDNAQTIVIDREGKIIFAMTGDNRIRAFVNFCRRSKRGASPRRWWRSFRRRSCRTAVLPEFFFSA